VATPSGVALVRVIGATPTRLSIVILPNFTVSKSRLLFGIIYTPSLFKIIYGDKLLN
jgi:hypothetical protein